MSIQKQILHRKNSSGSYDTLYLQTSSDVVVRDDGSSVEDILPTTQANDDAPERLKTGKIAVGPNKVFIGIGNLPYEVTTSNANVEISVVPSQSGTVTYKAGTIQTPSWNNFNETELYITGDTSGTNVGDYTVTFTPKPGYIWADTLDRSGKEVTWSISKATPTVTAPTAKSNLTYNTNSQALINAGSTTGGTLQYAAVSHGSTAPGSAAYSTTIPEGTNAGTYDVYYRVVGDSNWNDVAATYIQVSIAKATFTANVSISGYTYAGTKSTPSVDNNPGNGTVTYYGRSSASGSGTNWNSVTATTYDAGTRYCYAVIAETDNYQACTTGNASFTISQATGTMSLNKSSVSFDSSTTSTTVTVTTNAGTVTATSTNSNVAKTSVSGKTVTITNQNKTSGTATVTISVAASTNYTSPGSKTVSVSASFGWSGSTTLGDEVTWCGVTWIIVDVQTSNITFMKKTALKQMSSGWGKGSYSSKTGGRYVSTSVDSSKGSYCVDECIAYANTLSSHTDWAMAIDTTIYETTGKIFIPTQGQLGATGGYAPYSGSNGQQNYTDTAQSTNRGDGTARNASVFENNNFSYFDGSVTSNQTKLVCKNDAGTAVAWWEATAYFAGYVWYVDTIGYAGNNYDVEVAYIWLRPFVRLAR